MSSSCSPSATGTEVAFTVDLVRNWVAPGASIVEVGCGDGDVAAALQRLGYQVIAIDADAARIERSRAKGVDARVAAWPDIDLPRQDAVLFTRSLHHVADLDGSLDAARAHGLLIVEDFDFHAADRATAEWFAARVRENSAAIDEDRDSFAARILCADDPLAAWHTDHDHDLHSAERIATAVAQRFTIEHSERVPYIFRYASALNLFDEEQRLGSAGEIALIGRRIVAG